jgi:hypothetical protein
LQLEKKTQLQLDLELEENSVATRLATPEKNSVATRLATREKSRQQSTCNRKKNMVTIPLPIAKISALGKYYLNGKSNKKN